MSMVDALTPLYVVFDIDGTLSDLTHRLHYVQQEQPDWDAFFEACSDDAPKPAMIAVAQAIAVTGAKVEYWTGRPERVRGKTIMWLLKHGLKLGQLRMRKDGDHRHDDTVKLEYLLHSPKPDIIFEDRKRVVDAFRAKGITVAQVDVGDF